MVTITPAAAASLDVATLASSLASAVSVDGSSDVVDVVIVQTTAIVTPLPTGVTKEQMAAAFEADICKGTLGCSVTPSSRRQLREARALQSSASFTVRRELNATSGGLLGAPTVNTSAVASTLGVAASAVVPTVTVQSVAASVTVVSSGSSSVGRG